MRAEARDCVALGDPAAQLGRNQGEAQHTPVVPALRRRRPEGEDLYEARLSYIGNWRHPGVLTLGCICDRFTSLRREGAGDTSVSTEARSPELHSWHACRKPRLVACTCDPMAATRDRVT